MIDTRHADGHAQTIEEAYAEGYVAAQASRDLDANPYTGQNPDLHDAWEDGWLDENAEL